jgi:hypothetical protein
MPVGKIVYLLVLISKSQSGDLFSMSTIGGSQIYLISLGGTVPEIRFEKEANSSIITKRRLLSFVVDRSIIELTGDRGEEVDPSDCPGNAIYNTD